MAFFCKKKLSDVTRVTPIKMDHFFKFPIINGPGQARTQCNVLLTNDPGKLLFFSFKSEVSIVLRITC